MNLAQREWEDAHIAHVLELLAEERPGDGETDLPAFEWFYLDRLCHADVRTFRGYAGRAFAVAYSPDGRRIAAAGRDQTVKVWDAESRQETLTLKGHTGRVQGVSFSPDGRCIASASSDKTIRIWDAGNR